MKYDSFQTNIGCFLTSSKHRVCSRNYCWPKNILIVSLKNDNNKIVERAVQYFLIVQMPNCKYLVLGNKDLL